MKTIKLALIALLATGLSVATVNAQDAAKSKSTKASAQKSDGAKTNASGQHLKKDGTPDMRYKENKQAAAKSGDKTTATKSSGAATTGTTGGKAKSKAKSTK